MDVPSPVAVSFALVFIVLTLFYLYLTWNFDYWAKQGIPYAKPLPMLGNIQLGQTGVEKVDLARYKKYGRIYGTFEGRQPVLFVGDPEVLKKLMLKDFTTFRNRINMDFPEKEIILRKLVFILRDDEWKTIRKIVVPTLISGKMKQMVEQVEECGWKLTEHLEQYAMNKEPIDLVKYSNCYISNLIANYVFGFALNSSDNIDNEFVKHSEALFRTSKIRTLIYFGLPQIFKRLIVHFIMNQDSIAFFKAKVMDVIELRKRNKVVRDCFVDLLLQVQESKNAMTETTIIAQCVTFIAGGLETMATTMSYAAYILAINVKIQDKLISEVDEMMESSSGKITYDAIQQMPYLDMVVSETLRMYPPITRIRRECSEDNYKLGTATLTKSMQVQIPVCCIHHDEEFYPNPDEFIPERFTAENRARRTPYTYLPFGSGPRFCIGNRFSLMQIKLGLVQLLSKYRLVKCPQTQIPVKSKTTNDDVMSPESVNLVLEPRNRNEC